MKNIGLLPEDLRETIMRAGWQCSCGQEGLRLSVTRKGSVQAHCFKCGQTIFFNDVQIFRLEDPFAAVLKEEPVAKKMVKGGWSYWYGKNR